MNGSLLGLLYQWLGGFFSWIIAISLAVIVGHGNCLGTSAADHHAAGVSQRTTAHRSLSLKITSGGTIDQTAHALPL
jgi:hypothetical protein